MWSKFDPGIRDALFNPARVVVCGLPGSGNRIVAEHLIRCGIQPVIDYGDGAGTFEANVGAYPDGLVVPYRLDEVARRRDAEKRVGVWSRMREAASRVTVAVALNRCEHWLVLYEDIFLSGGMRLDSIVVSLGHRGTPLPKHLVIPTMSRKRKWTGSLDLDIVHQTEIR